MKNIKQKLSKINQKVKELYQMNGIFLLTAFNSHSQKETQLRYVVFFQLLKETNNKIMLEPRGRDTDYPFEIQLQYDGIMYFALIKSTELKKLKQYGIIKGKIEDYIKKEER